MTISKKTLWKLAPILILITLGITGVFVYRLNALEDIVVPNSPPSVQRVLSIRVREAGSPAVGLLLVRPATCQNSQGTGLPSQDGLFACLLKDGEVVESLVFQSFRSAKLYSFWKDKPPIIVTETADLNYTFSIDATGRVSEVN